ncbi:alpha/beta hydrolase [Sphingosinicella sp. BN140058]|uniref:alpha/beta hydrolase n=1 Tax=Sphingosinicella sp. BN140058 TaxID=1892855 RepID=UPI0010109AFB|nr:alpha/beta fold hydrolase [Sphingosinicella sp. BN140058]QAY79096.1 hypothetical protein ETR14_23085 [Sphingosinicella sp. BN140058]
MIWKLLLAPVFLYFIIVLAMFLFQDRLLFPAAMVGGARMPPGAELLRLQAASGETLHGLHLPAAGGPAAAGSPLLLGFGGNGWNAAAAAEYLHALYPDHDVVVFHYRGYAPSTGRAGAAALTADSLLVHDEVARRFPGRPIVAIGFSVGTGVAAYLASRRNLAGLILVTPFDSLRDVAATQYPWLPVRLLFRHPMPSAEWLRGRRLPVAILAGGSDTLVRPECTDALRKAVPNLVFDRTIAGAGHNDIYQRSAFQLAMDGALRAIKR